MAILATRFSRTAAVLRRDRPLSDVEIRSVAPSIYAPDPHISRSERYAYIPTAQILAGLRREGFEPFMVCQSRARLEDRRGHTKHMLRLRHAGQMTGDNANEIILINSHDGTSAYQMLAGVFRFVCHNGTIFGAECADIRVPHKGDIQGRVIEGAYTVLKEFEAVDEHVAGMKALTLSAGEQRAFADAALALRYDPQEGAAPITSEQLLVPRRIEDRAPDMWTTFNRVQEHMMRGGLQGRNVQGRRTTTRAVQAIDTTVKLNRALWVLAEKMRELRA